MMADALLQLQNVESNYGPIMAVRGISLTVPEGSIVAVLGGNGAGKTTILKTISGALDPLKGTIHFQNREIQKQDPDVVARAGIAHVPEGREVFPFLSVRENLLMGAYSRNNQAAILNDLEVTYDYFPILRERNTQQAAYLSGGEQQMLAIGRALMSRPKLMLLDEPSLGLSPILVQEIFAIITRVNREQGVTILLVEQNARMALKTASYGYVLENGRIVMENSTEKLMQSEDIREFYLGIQSREEHAESQRRRRWKRKKTWR